MKTKRPSPPRTTRGAPGSAQCRIYNMGSASNTEAEFFGTFSHYIIYCTFARGDREYRFGSYSLRLRPETRLVLIYARVVLLMFPPTTHSCNTVTEPHDAHLFPR
jgi:hypothetical protein